MPESCHAKSPTQNQSAIQNENVFLQKFTFCQAIYLLTQKLITTEKSYNLEAPKNQWYTSTQVLSKEFGI